MTMNNLFEHFVRDRSIPDKIELGYLGKDNEENVTSVIKKLECKRKRGSDPAEDEEKVNIRNKKVKFHGPIVISELSKAFVNEQSQVYFPTWLTHFPTVRLKMVTGIKNGNCVHEKNDFGNGKTWDANLTVKETDSRIRREIKTETIDQKVTRLKFEETKDLGTKSLKMRSQPVVVLKKLDIRKYNNVKIENCDDKQKEILDDKRQSEVQPAGRISGKSMKSALTNLLRIQRFPKPVIRLKLLNEKDINCLKGSILKNSETEHTGTKATVTPKRTIFSSVEPVSRLRKIMETIEISSIYAEKRKEIKTVEKSKIKGTENKEKQMHPRQSGNLEGKNEKSAPDVENVKPTSGTINKKCTSDTIKEKCTSDTKKEKFVSDAKKEKCASDAKKEKFVLDAKKGECVSDAKKEKCESEGGNVTNLLQKSEKEELRNPLKPKLGRPRKIIKHMVTNSTSTLNKREAINVVQILGKECVSDAEKEKCESEGGNVTNLLQKSEKEELRNPLKPKLGRPRKIIKHMVTNSTSTLNKREVINVVQILGKKQFPNSRPRRVGKLIRPLKSAKRKPLSDLSRKKLCLRVKRLGHLSKWQDRDRNVQNKRISSNSVKAARKLLKTARNNKTEGQSQRPKTTNRLPQKFKTRAMNACDARGESEGTENKTTQLETMDKRKNSEKEAKNIKFVHGRKSSDEGGNDEEKSKQIKFMERKKYMRKEGTKNSKKMRCRQCENCLRPNCGECVHCVDMKRFGGPQLIKQCCVNRRCLYKCLPKYLIKQIKLKPPSFTLTPKLQSFKQSKKPFLQDQPCWKLPLKFHQCRQCANDFTYNSTDGILCRFYSFRRLEFKDDDVLTPVGFASSSVATEKDSKLLNPDPEEPADLDVDTSKFILHYVGEQFCGLVEHEKLTRRRFITKDIVVKRAIQGVREMCDVCDTTIFNFHFSCGLCGFVVCVDCYDGDEVLWMACHRTNRHVKDELMLTQTIPGDILWALNSLTHKICNQNGIAMSCSCSCFSKENDASTINTSKPVMEAIDELYNQKRKNVCSFDFVENELPRESTSSAANCETNRKPLCALTAIISSVVEQYFSGGIFDAKKHNAEKYPGPMKGGNEYCSRIFTLTESRSMFPGVPHSWLCEGRLLWLHEPQHSKNVPLFQEIWKRGQPILVSNVHEHLDESLWHPKAFSRDFGELENDLIDCISGSVFPELMKNFWDGFQDPQKRLKDKDGRHLLLKLKDWPPGDDFSEVLPTRFQDLMKALPLPDYTHRDGKLNLTARLPDYFVPPDLGPKLYIAYGSTQYPSQGTTNLHLDMSDAVNVMVYAGVIKNENEKAHIQEAYHAVCEAGCDILARKRVREKGVQLGAIWHIFKSIDAPKIRKFLNTLAIEKGEQPEAKSDPIHDQRWYLDSDLRSRLYNEYAVDGYAIAQCVGDAVFIPAGAPHQVRNLHSCIKVAEDFVTPENIGHCLKLTQEFRHLSNSHTNHEDKLQVKNIAYHAVKDSLSVIMANQAKTKI